MNKKTLDLLKRYNNSKRTKRFIYKLHIFTNGSGDAEGNDGIDNWVFSFKNKSDLEEKLSNFYSD